MNNNTCTPTECDVRVHDIVKVTVKHESLWCEVDAITERICFLTIYNQPAYTKHHGLEQGDGLILPVVSVNAIAPRRENVA